MGKGKTKILDKDNLNALFNLPDIKKESPEMENSQIIKKDNNISFEKEKEVDDELKSLLSNSNQILEIAKDIVNSAPDAEVITSASSMINSITALIGELNRSVILKKRYEYISDIEKMKIKARKELTELRAQIESKRIPQIGAGSTINVQNNTLIPFTQEEIVRNILREESEGSEENEDSKDSENIIDLN